MRSATLTCIVIAAVAAAAAFPAAANNLDSQFARESDFTNELSSADLESSEPLPLPLEKRPAQRADEEIEGQGGPPREADRGAFSRRTRGDVQTVPLRYTGKLFVSRGGKRHHCSAQFITPRVILTAAHCVRDRETGKWYDDFRFALQYQRGFKSKQYGYVCISTNKGWVKKADGPTPREWDYAMLLLKEPTATGHFGWASGWRGQYKNAVKVGYPGEIYEGQLVTVEQGPLFFPKDRKGIVGLRHGNAKSGPGSSGGAFIGSFSQTEGGKANYVISVTSFSYEGAPDVDYGPYFDDEFKVMLDHVAGGCKSRQ